MISKLLDYVRGFRRVSFRYIDSQGVVTERWGYSINKKLAERCETIEMEGESGIPSSFTLSMFDIPENVRKVRCRFIRINSITLSTVRLHTLNIEECEFVEGSLFYIGQVNHLRIFKSNMDFFELFYPEHVRTIDVIDTGLKQLPGSISRCSFLKSHLNIPYTISTSEQFKSKWFWIFYSKADSEYENLYFYELNVILKKYFDKYGQIQELIDGLSGDDIGDLEVMIKNYEDRFNEKFEFGETIRTNSKEFKSVE